METSDITFEHILPPVSSLYLPPSLQDIKPCITCSYKDTLETPTPSRLMTQETLPISPRTLNFKSSVMSTSGLSIVINPCTSGDSLQTSSSNVSEPKRRLPVNILTPAWTHFQIHHSLMKSRNPLTPPWILLRLLRARCRECDSVFC